MKAPTNPFVAADVESGTALAVTALNGVGCMPVTVFVTFPKNDALVTSTEPCYSP